jgi:hypothetical protein
VVAVGCEGIIAHDATLGASNIDTFLAFIQTKVIPSPDKQG